MAFLPSMHGNRLVIGGEVPAGITKTQTKPYDTSLLGGLSILNGPLQVGVAPLSTPPLGSIHVGQNPATSGPLSLSGVYVNHPLIGANITSPVLGFKVVAPRNEVAGSVYLVGLLDVTGNVSIKGTLSVTGAASFGSITTINGGNGTIAGTLTAAALVSNGALTVASNADLNGDLDVDGTTNLDNTNVVGILDVDGSATIDSVTIDGSTVTATTFSGTATGNKTLAAFDIPHVRQKGKRIRHIVAEGPEPGIYIRGTLKGGNVIELPEYWDGLVDPETITVTLTPVGSYQELYVDKIEWGKRVIVKNNQGSSIHCYYEVWVARWLNPMNHEDKLKVVYEGESPDDYPDGNKNFLIGGWDYDRRDPQWGPPE